MGVVWLFKKGCRVFSIRGNKSLHMLYHSQEEVMNVETCDMRFLMTFEEQKVNHQGTLSTTE